MKPASFTCFAVSGVPEVRQGDDLAGLISEHAELLDGDVVAVTSKVVSKAEGRVAAMDRTAAVEAATDRVVAVRGATSIVRTRHGLVMAAAGVDASNTAPGTVVLLPLDPDRSARDLRERLRRVANVGVLVTDTAGRAWRNGQTDLAIGAAGVEVVREYAGDRDGYGNLLEVTAPAVADELAAAADLVKGKVARSPVAVVRGLAGLVLPAGVHGAGAGALVREEADDLFGYGAREAVRVSMTPGEGGRRGFGAATTAGELAAALRAVAAETPGGDAEERARVVEVAGGQVLVEVAGGQVVVRLGFGGDVRSARLLGNVEARLRATGVSHGWESEEVAGTGLAVSGREAVPGCDVLLRFRPASS